jgi:ribosomal protein S3
LPKNRRETSFVRFIIKVVKTFAAEREEVWGLKIKFKGRVNRWRRTKVISGQRGIVPLHTIQNRIEYGTAQAINRKGALGIHIWIWYNPVFKTLLKDTFHNYFKYSKYLNQKK